MFELTVAAKQIGAVNLPNFCPRCFWIRLRTKSLPFQSFPGIFSSIDSYTKKITKFYYEKNGVLPPWFKGLDLIKPLKTPSLKDFRVVHEPTGITIQGVPDDIFQKKSSNAIGDYKTAKFSKNADALAPIYDGQLNAYAYIGDRVGFSHIDSLFLAYYEPFTDIDITMIDQKVTEEMIMSFRPKILTLDVKPELIDTSLEKIKDIYELPAAPSSTPGCKDCSDIDNLFNILGKGELKC